MCVEAAYEYQYLWRSGESYPPEQELWVVVSRPVWVLGMNSGASEK